MKLIKNDFLLEPTRSRAGRNLADSGVRPDIQNLLGWSMGVRASGTVDPREIYINKQLRFTLPEHLDRVLECTVRLLLEKML